MTRTLALAGTAAILSLACSPGDSVGGSGPGSPEKAAKGEARESADSDPRNAQSAPLAELAPLAPIAEAYVRLVLAVGEHDGDYVDAYYGPKEWRTEASSGKVSLPEIYERAGTLLEKLADVSGATGAAGADSAMTTLRCRYLETQLGALRSRVEMLQGKRMTFDEESRALYDAVAPNHSDEHYQSLVCFSRT